MKYVLLISTFVIPIIGFAAPTNFQGVVDWITGFISLLIPVILGITFVYILWGITNAWIIKGGSEEGVESGKMVVVTGVIGLIVMVGIWGLVSLVRNAIFF